MFPDAGIPPDARVVRACDRRWRASRLPDDSGREALGRFTVAASAAPRWNAIPAYAWGCVWHLRMAGTPPRALLRGVLLALAWPAAAGLLYGARWDRMLMARHATLFVFIRRWPRRSFWPRALTLGVPLAGYAVGAGLCFGVFRSFSVATALVVASALALMGAVSTTGFVRAVARSCARSADVLAAVGGGVWRGGEMVDSVSLHGVPSSEALPMLRSAAHRADACGATLTVVVGAVDPPIAAQCGFTPMSGVIGFMRRDPHSNFEV